MTISLWDEGHVSAWMLKRKADDFHVRADSGSKQDHHRGFLTISSTCAFVQA